MSTDYMKPFIGNAGNFGTQDRSGRELDGAGKLKKQTARKDLECTDHIDINRRPQFKQV